METQFFTSIPIDVLVQRIAAEVVKQLSNTPINNNKEVWLTRKQTAKLLQVSLPTLNEWTKISIIKAKRINSRVRYAESDVIAALENYNKYERRAA